MNHPTREPRGAGGPRLKPVTVPGPAGDLEGLLQERDAHDPAVAALVLHPHPLHGGTLHNKVVHRVASVLHGLGAAVLRFNFRGVGRSHGSFDRGEGEQEDARAALAWMRSRYPGVRCWLAGFSFGAWVAARLAASESDVEWLILVAPPVATADFAVLRTAAVPKIVVQGMADDLCPPAALQQEYPGWAEPKTLLEVEGATHFFDRRLGALADVLLRSLAAPAGGTTSSRP